MTLEDYAYTGELIAAAAVVVTLIYLARQLRQANQAYRRVIAVHLGSARARKWWDVWGNVPFDPEFCAMVKDFLEKQPLSDYFRTFEKLIADADPGPGVAR